MGKVPPDTGLERRYNVQTFESGSLGYQEWAAPYCVICSSSPSTSTIPLSPLSRKRRQATGVRAVVVAMAARHGRPRSSIVDVAAAVVTRIGSAASKYRVTMKSLAPERE